MHRVNPLRKFFPFFEQQQDWVYLDSAATTQKPQQVIDAITQFYQQNNTNIHRGNYGLANEATQMFESVRDNVKRFINAASRDEIIFTSGTTDSINLVAQCYAMNFPEGSEILVSALEHHANIVPWQQIAQKNGLKLVQIPLTNDYQIDLEAYKNLFNSKTALVCVTHMSNALGIVTPLKEMIDIAHQYDAKVCVDGAQSIAHQAVDIQKLGADFYSFSGHKMYGPTGVGVLFAKKEHHDNMSPYRFGGEMIKAVSFTESTFAESPGKFEAGTPNIAGVIGLGAAINFLREHKQTIEQAESETYQYLCLQLAKIDEYEALGAQTNRQAIVSLKPKQNQFDIASLLDRQKIALRSGKHCAMPLMTNIGIEGTNRLSIACYTNKDDIDRLIKALSRGTHDTDSRSNPLPNGDTLSFEIVKDTLDSMHSREQKLKQIMNWSNQIESPNEAIRKQEYLIEGCESKVWLKHDNNSAQMDSASRMMRGICAVLITIREKNPSSPDDFMKDLNSIGFDKIVTSSKRNGINQVIAKLID